MSDNIKAIGRVAATEKFPITVECFYFLTKKDIVVEPFDIVKVENFDQSITYGVVEEISHVTDSASFLSSFISNDFGNNMSYDDVSCRVEMNYIKARVIGNSKNINFPVINNSRVFKMYYDDFDDGAKKVLGFASDDKNAITCGYIEMYENEKSEEKTKIPVRLDSDFLIGPKGAHLNISGISGLAAKTSYAMFLLKAIQEKFATDANKGNVKKRNKKNGNANANDNSVSIVIFNVKGCNLLGIDKENKSDKKIVKLYEDIGLKGAPFQDVTYLYPAAHEKNSFVPEDVYKKHKNKFEYTFDYKYDKKNLDMLFLDIDDDSQTMGSIIDYVNDGAEEFSDENMDNWEKFLERVEVLQKCEKNKGSNNGSDNGSNSGIATVSWRKFFRHIKRLISKNDLFSSLNKEEDNKKQTAVEETRIGTVINDIKANHVYVIDIAKLDSNMQAFVFGTTIKEIMEYKLNQSGNQSDNDKPKKIIIFMDELNKYAPAVGGKNSLICQQILEIAERGRSLGIILFGAEQFMSGVHYRVTGNCATFVYGKTNANELSKAHYKYIPPAYQHMMSRLKAGECILQNVCLSSLLRIKFPKPIYEELT